MRQPPHVLVVDDDVAHRKMIAHLLRENGYAVELAGDGVVAVERAQAEPPDLAIVDVNMPRLDGISVCRRLKADPPTCLVPVLIVTGVGHREQRLKGVRAGCDGFLTKPVDLEELAARVESALRAKALTDGLDDAENVIYGLARALEAKDPYTWGHSERVGLLAAALGRAAGLGAADGLLLQRAGRLHDVGKIGTPLTILHRPGPLSAEERAVVQLHPAIGEAICRPLRSLGPLLALVRGHHERLDGTGYPDHLGADQIGLQLRCLSVADVYDALTSERPYRGAMTSEAALNLMRREPGAWDQSLVSLLAERLAAPDAEAMLAPHGVEVVPSDLEPD
jgi:putative two-component system response regulator